jgi:hypothetical protein
VEAASPIVDESGPQFVVTFHGHAFPGLKMPVKSMCTELMRISKLMNT